MEGDEKGRRGEIEEEARSGMRQKHRERITDEGDREMKEEWRKKGKGKEKKASERKEWVTV